MSIFPKENILKVDAGVLLFGVRLRNTPFWMALFFGRYGFIIIGTGNGKQKS